MKPLDFAVLEEDGTWEHAYRVYVVTVDKEGAVVPRGDNLWYDDARDVLNALFAREGGLTHGLLMKWDWSGDGHSYFLDCGDEEELARLRAIRHWPEEVRTLTRLFGPWSLTDPHESLRKFPDHLVTVYLRGRWPQKEPSMCRTCGR